MAPEIWKRQCQTVKADIFSLGVTLYDLCMLRSLFTGASEVEVQRRIDGWTAADAAAAASQLLPQYSLELAGLLEAMLQVGRGTMGKMRAGVTAGASSGWGVGSGWRAGQATTTSQGWPVGCMVHTASWHCKLSMWYCAHPFTALQPDRELRPSADEILERHGTPERLAALPRPPADACTDAVLEVCEEEGAPRVLPLLPPVEVTDDLQQLNDRLPLPSCGWPKAPGAAAGAEAVDQEQ